MSQQSSSGRYVNVVPVAKIKKEVIDDVEDTVYCKICKKGYASEMALNNHARMEHTETYSNGDPTVWTQYVEHSPSKTKEPVIMDEIQLKTVEVISEMKPTNMMSLASNDVSYIIIKSDELTPNPPRRRGRGLKEDKNKSKDTQAISGPFECLQPSTTVEDGTCHQIFFSCCEYSIHYRDEHTRRRKGLRCQVCEKPLACNGVEPQAPYTCEGGVLQHMRMHTGDRPFPCTFCSKAFTQKSGLDQHVRIHTKVRPYRCVVCTKTFSQSVHLKQHMRTHTQVAPFQCGFCNKRFKQSSHLNYHLKTHNPANMSENQKAKYSELIGLIAKEYVEVGMDQGEVECAEQEQSEVEMEIQETENEQEVEEEKVIVEGEEIWINVSMNE
ncbi:hypothetical protein K1T71_015053 [Dendrolimus kikuchii]|nr:hypothetical protein K1T71_015053 [Dendrolimus kikuchii]